MLGIGRKQVCGRPELATVLLGQLQITGRNGLSGATLEQAEHNYHVGLMATVLAGSCAVP